MSENNQNNDAEILAAQQNYNQRYNEYMNGLKGGDLIRISGLETAFREAETRLRGLNRNPASGIPVLVLPTNGSTPVTGIESYKISAKVASDQYIKNPYYHDGVDYSTLSRQGYDDLLKKITEEINRMQTDYNISKQAGVSGPALALKLQWIEPAKKYLEMAKNYKAQFYPEPIKPPLNIQTPTTTKSNQKSNSILETIREKSSDPIVLVGVGASALLIIGVGIIVFSD